jgi:hypothetical protein
VRKTTARNMYNNNYVDCCIITTYINVIHGSSLAARYMNLVLSESFPLLPTHSRCRVCLFSFDHTQTHTTVGRTPLDEGSARRRDFYLTTQTLTRDKHPCPGWDSNPMIPESARPHTYALDRGATGIGYLVLSQNNISLFAEFLAIFTVSLCSKDFYPR